jgi:hypothetical protein
MAKFLLTFDQSAPPVLEAFIVDQVRYVDAQRLQENVWLLPCDMDLADRIVGAAEEYGVACTLHMLTRDVVPMTGRMESMPLIAEKKARK